MAEELREEDITLIQQRAVSMLGTERLGETPNPGLEEQAWIELSSALVTLRHLNAVRLHNEPRYRDAILEAFAWVNPESPNHINPPTILRNTETAKKFAYTVMRDNRLAQALKRVEEFLQQRQAVEEPEIVPDKRKIIANRLDYRDHPDHYRVEAPLHEEETIQSPVKEPVPDHSILEPAAMNAEHPPAETEYPRADLLMPFEPAFTPAEWRPLPLKKNKPDIVPAASNESKPVSESLPVAATNLKRKRSILEYVVENTGLAIDAHARGARGM